MEVAGVASVLAGKRIVVTRAQLQAWELSNELRRRGAEPVEIPTISIVEPTDGGAGLREVVASLNRYEWVIFTSKNGAARFCQTLGPRSVPDSVSIAAIGPGTAAELSETGIQADLVPDVFVAEEFLKSFPLPPKRGKVALIRATDGRDVLPDGLQRLGWDVDVVAAYTTVVASFSEEAFGALRTADIVTFTSSSTVRNLIALAGATAMPSIVACIGPATSKTARDLGLHVDIEATEHTIVGLVKALEAFF